MYRVNVSSVQDFYQCRFRWWCKWVMNRVPVATAPALDEGRLLHTIFEDAFNGKDIVKAATDRCAEFRDLIPTVHPSAQPNALKAVQTIEDLREALPLWQDRFPVTEVLEVEEAFEWPDPEYPWLLWLGRPDRVITSRQFVWHAQNRGLASSQNFGTYLRLQKRSYHEHLYAEALHAKYCGKKRGQGKRRLRYGGTIFNLVRKLKYRTNVGRTNEATKTAQEMFYQQGMSIKIDSPQHKTVMMAMRDHVHEMIRVQEEWENEERIPAPNEKMNGGYGGNSEDPYFKLLIGEVKLSDKDVFKNREDLYATG